MRARPLGGALFLLLLPLLAAAPSRADRISRAAIAVDASPAGADVTMDLTWSASEPRTELVLYLHQGLDVKSATVAGKDVEVASEPVAGSRLAAWTLSRTKVSSQAGFPAGENPIVLKVAAAGDLADLRAGDDGGALYPGSGWFPRVAVSGDEVLPHTVTFRLPEGWSGIAAGNRGADGVWTASTGRPYAVWGSYREVAGDPTSTERAFSYWERKGDEAESPPPAMVALLLDALEVGLGEAEGAGDWKVVQTDRIEGGLRTLFWGGAGPERPELLERDLAGAMAAGFWTECFAFRGPRAAFLARALSFQLGDVAVSAARRPDDFTELESVTIGSRRDAFLAVLGDDRPLDGLVDLSADGDRLLRTRGALVAHVLAEYSPSRSRWMVDLAAFRKDHDGEELSWDTFSPSVFWKTRELIEPFLATTDLPDFRMGPHSVQETKMGGRRYSVEVSNQGNLSATAEVATFDTARRLIHSTRVHLEPGDSRVMKFADPEGVARVAVEPRGVVPQTDVSGESADVEPLEPQSREKLEARIPSFPFDQEPAPRHATGLSLDLGEIVISDFEGWVVPFSTHHGPSGACLLGQCKLTIRPQGDGEAPFLEAMDVSELQFPNARDLWIRFPLKVWDDIRPQLGDAVTSADHHSVLNRQNWVYSFSFETYFFEGAQAQVPPAGSELVVFRTGSEEWKGYVREPLADATVLRRLWNHLASETIWEDRR